MNTLYERVKSSLRERIVDGTYKPEQKIPSEAELIREFGVSAITVRRALRDLRVEGRLISRQGLGVFVADKPRITRSLNPDYRASLGDEMRRAGFTPSLKEISLTLVEPEPSIADALQVSASELIYKHEKIILANGKPVCFDVAFLRRQLGDLLRSHLRTEFLMPLLARHGVRYEVVDYRIEAASAMKREAVLLEVPIGTPLLGVWYYPVAPNQQRILIGHTLACAEWYAFEFRVPTTGQNSANSKADVKPRSAAKRG